MKEQSVNAPIDWKKPENNSAFHAHRYKDQLRYLSTLHPEEGFKASPGQSDLTPKEATRLRNWGYFARARNLNTILGNHGIAIKPRTR